MTTFTKRELEIIIWALAHWEANALITPDEGKLIRSILRKLGEK